MSRGGNPENAGRGVAGPESCTTFAERPCATSCGRRAAVLGTLGNGLVGGMAPARHTTPDAVVLHELLRQFRTAGAQAVAMEVSSHGLDQGRVNGVKFDVALFTNLTRDHSTTSHDGSLRPGEGIFHLAGIADGRGQCGRPVRREPDRRRKSRGARLHVGLSARTWRRPAS